MHLHIHLPDAAIALFSQLHAELHSLNRKADHIMATQAQAAQQLTDLGTKLDKISGETTSLVEAVRDLTAQIATAGEVTPELQAAMDAVGSKADAIDALVDDIAPNPTPTPEPTP